MAFTTLHTALGPSPTLTAACCLNHTHDAVQLARIVSSSVAPGPVLDVGCGTGGVAIPLLRARPDVTVTGVDVSSARGALATERAVLYGVAGRFRLVLGDVFAASLPAARSVVANPPRLPTAAGLSVPSRRGDEELFGTRLVRHLAARPDVADIWLHLFDFHGVGRRSGRFPTIEEVAASEGYEVSYPHRGWRACGPDSAIRGAIPALRRLFPEGRAVIAGQELQFADLPPAPAWPLLIEHSIVRLNRAPTHHGDRK